MTPQQMNYFTNLTNAIDAYLTAYADVEDTFQEAFDRNIPAELDTIEFQSTPSDLDHLTTGKLVEAFDAFIAIKAAMDAADREAWTDFLGVLRSWNR